MLVGGIQGRELSCFCSPEGVGWSLSWRGGACAVGGGRVQV